MRKRREEFFDLRVTLLLSPRVIKKSQTAADQRCDQNATFPHQHLIIAMQVGRAGNRQPLDQIELPQTEYKPPSGECHGKNNPDRDESDGERSAFAFSAHILEVPLPLGDGKGEGLSTAQKEN